MMDHVGFLSLHAWAVSVASIFVFATLCLSFSLILSHLSNYHLPHEQKWLIGVVFMVPVYSVESFASLWNSSISIECDILRNCYEAFALYSFANYLIACLGGEDEILESLGKKALVPVIATKSCGDDVEDEPEAAALHHPFPLKLLVEPWAYGEGMYRTIKFGIVQYMILKTVCALLSLLLELLGCYGDGEFNWNSGYPYITIILNFSQMWALYCLVQFYSLTHEELKHINPLPKFLCFKAIVFATWWQGVLIAVLCAVDVIPRSIDGIPKSQMAIAALVHTFVFPAPSADRNRACITPPPADASSLNERLLGDIHDEEHHVSYRKEPLDYVVEASNVHLSTTAASLKESVQDVVLGGGETVMQDVMITVTQVVEPVEKGISALHGRLQQLPWVSLQLPDVEPVEQTGQSSSDDIHVDSKRLLKE